MFLFLQTPSKAIPKEKVESSTHCWFQYAKCHSSFYFSLRTDDKSTSWASDAIPKRRNQTIRTGRRRFALLPRYERGGWRIQESFTKWNWVFVADIVALRIKRHPGITVVQLEPKCRRFPWRYWRSTRCENSAISVGVHDTRCYRSGFQSSSSERQRERNSRSPFAAPLYFSPRQVSKPANLLGVFSSPCGVFVPV